MIALASRHGIVQRPQHSEPPERWRAPDGDPDPHYVALLLFRAELVAWLESRLGGRGDRVLSVGAESRIDDGAEFGRHIQVNVCLDVPDDDLINLKLVIDRDF